MNASITESLIQERFNTTFAQMMAGEGGAALPGSSATASGTLPSDANADAASSDGKEKDPPPSS